MCGKVTAQNIEGIKIHPDQVKIFKTYKTVYLIQFDLFHLKNQDQINTLPMY